MGCEKITDWIRSDPAEGTSGIPIALLEHSRSCPDCSSQAAFLKSFQEKMVAVRTDPEKAAALKDALLSRLSRSQHIESPSMAPTSLPGLLSRWFGFSPRALAGGMAVLFLAFLGLWRFTTGMFSGQGTLFSIKGQNAQLIVSPKERIPLTDKLIACTRESGLILSGETSRAFLQFNHGGSIEVVGKGLLKVTREGFQGLEGRFLGTFRRGSGRGYVVKIPYATLGIRGTAVRFAITPDSTRFVVVEGQISVSPEPGINFLVPLPEECPIPPPSGSSSPGEFILNSGWTVSVSSGSIAIQDSLADPIAGDIRGSLPESETALLPPVPASTTVIPAGLPIASPTGEPAGAASPTTGRMCPNSQDGAVLEGASPTTGRMCPNSQDGAVLEGTSAASSPVPSEQVAETPFPSPTPVAPMDALNGFEPE